MGGTRREGGNHEIIGSSVGNVIEICCKEIGVELV